MALPKPGTPEFAEAVAELQAMAAPFATGLVKLRDAVRTGSPVNLSPEEAKAVLEGMVLLRGDGRS